MSLHIAAENDQTELALYLLRKDYDPNKQDGKGNLPLHYAVRCNNRYLIEAFINEGCKKNHANFNHDTPLHWAVRQGHLATINQLIHLGCDVTVCKPEGDGLIHLLVSRYGQGYPADFSQVLESLLLAGCDINTVAYCTHETPLYRALSMRQYDVAETLLSYGADPNISSPFDVTALQLACRNQDFRTVVLMLHCGICWKRERWITQVSYFQGQEWQGMLELILQWKDQCISLQNICRIVSRKFYHKNLYRQLAWRKDLPLVTKRFVMLYDLLQHCSETERTFNPVVFSGTWEMPDKFEAFGVSRERKYDVEDICESYEDI